MKIDSLNVDNRKKKKVKQVTREELKKYVDNNIGKIYYSDALAAEVFELKSELFNWKCIAIFQFILIILYLVSQIQIRII